jgi:hypothetical protein
VDPNKAMPISYRWPPHSLSGSPITSARFPSHRQTRPSVRGTPSGRTTSSSIQQDGSGQLIFLGAVASQQHDATSPDADLGKAPISHRPDRGTSVERGSRVQNGTCTIDRPRSSKAVRSPQDFRHCGSVATGTTKAGAHTVGPACVEALPGWGLDAWQPKGWSEAQWGRDGVWLEPFTAMDASHTLSQLYRHYHRLDLHAERHGHAGGGNLPMSHAVQGGGDEAMVESPCGHAACSLATVCIVEELEKSTAAYVRGRGADTFRLFATKRAITALRVTPQPISSDADVDSLGLGALPSCRSAGCPECALAASTIVGQLSGPIVMLHDCRHQEC